MTEVTQQLLHDYFSYDANVGDFIWRKRPFRSHIKLGATAGYIDKKGYICIGIASSHYFAHRLAWMYVYGHWPLNQIDHIDGNKTNNAIWNLRDVSASENAANRVQGIGYSWSSREQKFCSQVYIDGKSHWLGYFDTAEAARSAYVSAHVEANGPYSFLSRDVVLDERLSNRWGHNDA